MERDGSMIKKGCDPTPKILWDLISIWPLVLSSVFSLCTMKSEENWYPNQLFSLSNENQLIYSFYKWFLAYSMCLALPRAYICKVNISGSSFPWYSGQLRGPCAQVLASEASDLPLMLGQKTIFLSEANRSFSFSFYPKKRNKSPLGSLSVVKG